MQVAIIKYNAGNIQSVSYALERLNIKFTITNQWEEIKSADKVIFPGVGEASTTMNYLKDHKLDQLIVNLKQPVLGICLGMQLLCDYSEENNTNCLGIFNQKVKRFESEKNLKVPHMGWNTITNISGWINQKLENTYSYFVHSYYVPVNEFTTAQTSYGTNFSAALQKNNFYAVQFHPEKSAETGNEILKNFINI